MRDRAVVPELALNGDLRRLRRLEELSGPKFLMQPCVEVLDVAVLPRRALDDIGSLASNRLIQACKYLAINRIH